MTKLNPDADLRKHLIALLQEGNAHITFADAVKEYPFERLGIGRVARLIHLGNCWSIFV